MKILVVDDSAEALLAAKARLAQEGHEIVCASGGKAGLEAAAREHPDLVLLDVDMPDLSGFEICRMLKADASLGATPVIFLSSSDDRDDKARGLELGAVDYVAKPFDCCELQARVRAALENKRLQDLLAKRARIDALTELANREAFEEHLRQEWSRVQRVDGVIAVAMADIDHFKRVNDTFGHPMGDRLLGEIGRVLIRQCRGTDFPARYGGEEFAVICPHTAVGGAYLLARRCRAAVENIRLFSSQRKQARVTMSFGVADSSRAPSCEALLQIAEQALCRAKREGCNRVVRSDADISWVFW